MTETTKKPTIVKLMPDWGIGPLWVSIDGGIYDPYDTDDITEVVPLSTELRHDIAAWNERFQATLEDDDPANSDFPTREAAEQFVADGGRWPCGCGLNCHASWWWSTPRLRASPGGWTTLTTPHTCEQTPTCTRNQVACRADFAGGVTNSRYAVADLLSPRALTDHRHSCRRAVHRVAAGW